MRRARSDKAVAESSAKPDHQLAKKSSGEVETADYIYTDESGAPLYKVIRFEDPKGIRPKKLRQKKPVFKNGSAG